MKNKKLTKGKFLLAKKDEDSWAAERNCLFLYLQDVGPSNLRDLLDNFDIGDVIQIKIKYLKGKKGWGHVPSGGV